MNETTEFDDILGEVKKERELDRRHTNLLMSEHNIDETKRNELEALSYKEREAKAKELANSKESSQKQTPGQLGKRLGQVAKSILDNKESHYFKNNQKNSYFNQEDQKMNESIKEQLTKQMNILVEPEQKLTRIKNELGKVISEGKALAEEIEQFPSAEKLKKLSESENARKYLDTRIKQRRKPTMSLKGILALRLNPLRIILLKVK
ncbi:hypothetical protein [Enterococcus rivorum]|uniref:hypothetical protein n=1 Tax=Enterococcus rivorum TaxID=762845 RepID=UPI003638834E